MFMERGKHRRVIRLRTTNRNPFSQSAASTGFKAVLWVGGIYCTCKINFENSLPAPICIPPYSPHPPRTRENKNFHTTLPGK